MATTVNMHQAKTELSDLVSRAEAGEEIIIARRNKPVARLVPVALAAESKDFSAGAPAAGSGGTSGSRFRDSLLDHESGESTQRGFADDGKKAEFDLEGLAKGIDAGEQFTLMRSGRPAARVVPFAPDSAEAMGYGMLAHLRGTIPENLFLEPLPEDELKLWEEGE